MLRCTLKSPHMQHSNLNKWDDGCMFDNKTNLLFHILNFPPRSPELNIEVLIQHNVERA